MSFSTDNGVNALASLPPSKAATAKKPLPSVAEANTLMHERRPIAPITSYFHSLYH
jgi:hypothetical protein